MPTPTGLPKVGEVWEKTSKLPKPGGRGWDVTVTRFVVLERTSGDSWSMRVHVSGDRVKQRWWSDVAYWFSTGCYKYIGQAGPETKKRLGLR